MKHLITLLMLLVFPLTVLATGQNGDILLWKGDTLTVFSNPLELRQDIDSLRTKLFGSKEPGMNTGCWRGYIAEWEILENELYLTNILSCQYYRDSVNADLKKLFGADYKNGKVKASWVTGELLIPKGKLVHYVHQGYQSFYEYELVLTFENGSLIKQKQYDNSKSHKSVFAVNPDSLRQFIYSNINWREIPDLKEDKVVVVLSLYSGSDAKPDSIEIFKGAENELLNKEAIRVVRKLPDWNVYYRRGKVYPMRGMLPVVFNEENRKKYSH